MFHLESLVHRDAIRLEPKLVPGAPNAKLLEAADLTKSCRYSEKMHAAVEVILHNLSWLLSSPIQLLAGLRVLLEAAHLTVFLVLWYVP